MINTEIRRQIQQIEEIINKVGTATASEPEMMYHWAKYICIISAGLMENGIKEIYSEYAQKKVSAPVAGFVRSQLNLIRNPKASKFLDVSRSFKDDWHRELIIYFDDNGRGDALNSIMDNRHLIAHGKHNNAGLSFVRIKEYTTKCIDVLNFIEGQTLR
jgi:hypothetical protein